jgi:hypothetical protein
MSSKHLSSPGVMGALLCLLKARNRAESTSSPIWDFAVEIHWLLKQGVTPDELRCLTLEGYVAHEVDTTSPRRKHRTFRKANPLSFDEKSCFILTPKGADRAAKLHGPVAPVAPDERPCWDKKKRELWARDLLVKHFTVQGSAQELILESFQEQGWPETIDDPLPRLPNKAPKQRLHNAINRLNQHQTHRLLHFRSDEQGRAIRWEWADCN